MMQYKMLSGAIAAALSLAACAEADSDTTGGNTADARSAEPATTEAADPLADEPQSTSDDGVLGSDRVMQGEWVRKQMAGAPAALFGAPETEASFSVRCEKDELVFVRSAMEPAGPVAMSLMAGGETRQLDANSTPDPLPTVTGRLEARDAFAAILAEAADPIAVRVGSQITLRMPAGAALRDVVRNCRD